MTQLFVLCWLLLFWAAGAERHDARALVLRGARWRLTEGRWYGRRVVVRVQVMRV